jgi:hypothetical protein
VQYLNISTYVVSMEVRASTLGGLGNLTTLDIHRAAMKLVKRAVGSGEATVVAV